MSYTPDPLDPTRPTTADDAGQLTGELRGIKARLVADKANIETLQNDVLGIAALSANVDVRITETMQGALGKTKLESAALSADLANFILGERFLRRIHTAWPHKPVSVPTSATDAKNRYTEFKAVSLASDREGRGSWMRPRAFLSQFSGNTRYIAMDPFAVIDNQSGRDLTYTIVLFYRAWADQRIDVRLVNGVNVLQTVEDIAVNPPGDTAIMRSITFDDITVLDGTSVELSVEGYIWAGGGDDIAYLEELVIKPAEV